MATGQLKRFEEFGLGRGVDATDPTPFVNKKPFQVRPICENAIICTDEGGALRSIIQKIESSQLTQINASLTIPKPIEIDAPAEYSRSIMQKGHVLGRKVVTRTVAFRKDRLDPSATGFEKFLKETFIADGDKLVVADGDKLAVADGDKLAETESKKSCPELLKFIETFAPSADARRILSLLEFITEYGITHYVSKIHLGAAEYRTMSETHYSRFVSGKQHLGWEKIAELAVEKFNQKVEKTTHLDEVKRIGYMDDSFVVKKDEHEGVVDVQLESIANLIRDEKLKKDVSAALNIYTYFRGCYAIGWKKNPIPPNQHIQLIKFIRPLERPPTKHEASHKYAICCNHGNDQLFLMIESGSNQVIATKCEGQLNFFHLQLTEKSDELIIMDYAEFSVRTETLVEELSYDFWPTPRYLKVKTLLGYNRGPLCVEDSVDEYYCRLKLRPRLYSKHRNVTLSDFTNGKDTFYICTSGRWGITGYLYLKPTKDGSFITACRGVLYLLTSLLFSEMMMSFLNNDLDNLWNVSSLKNSDGLIAILTPYKERKTFLLFVLQTTRRSQLAMASYEP
eukprot:Em0015g1164a